MVNEDYEPTDTEEHVLAVLEVENRANPLLIREQTGLGKGTVNSALANLTAAGWVRRVTRGLYEFVEDPRHGDMPPEVEQAIGDIAPTPEGNEIDQALRGWSRGRGEDEQRASRDVAQEATAWLQARDEPVRKSDVPVQKFAENDPVDREVDMLWTQVIRNAWTHAVETGFVEQPNSRAYVWVGADG